VSGTVVEACTSLAFGDGQSCTGTDASPLHFAYLQLDSESNLSHAMFRQDSTTQGRWTIPDPAGLSSVSPANPQTWNRYTYVANNPLSFVDPMGMQLSGPGQCSAPAGDSCNTGPSRGGWAYIALGWTELGGSWGVWINFGGQGSFGGQGNTGGGSTCYYVLLNPCGGTAANNGPGFFTKLNTCVVNNAKNYCIGGVANLISNTQIPGSGLASNSITDMYTLLTGQDGLLSSAWSATKAGIQWAAAASPPVMTNGPNSFTTISPASGSPQAILGNGTNYRGFWASAKRLLKSGAELKLAVDAGLTGALVLNCSLGQIQ
jgi:RHS repeat-associated protein